ncbi:uncharacterized protein EV420DRAFT_1646480 [Desarmillaria tabescens]|uniref:Uncharacterized protein n=1 Tax=Armillaria tabescens TaxID=1929756 RepID=A0AA39MYI0_ARMTA|nr:uncharacterized protein EV420DRAFT_1646480 [Desarmillaria tabescens]KAK0450560.1 hypothetical protein EV420DRAFT_1646480 [Desarmillaria tabescens]
MPLLGIFSKKHKKGGRDVTKNSSASINSEFESALSSPTSEYIHTDKSLPSSPNGNGRYLHPRDAAAGRLGGASASSSKLRLPFGRRKMGAASSSTVSNLTDYTSDGGYLKMGRLSSGAMSDVEPELPLPPIFGDPHSALSTRSLPDSHPHLHSHSPSPSLQQKRPFFNWSKSQNSTPSKAVLQKTRTPLSPLSPSPNDSESFNLKSFRHVRPPSPTHSTALHPPHVPVARPRNTSTASDSSQRISVAAFREAQARRSAAGSPVPSFRSISPDPNQQPPHARIASRSVSRNPLDGRRLSSLVYDSDSDESASSSEADSDEGRALGRRRTLTQQQRKAGGGRATRSEIGHGSTHSRPPRPPPPSKISTMSVPPPEARKRASLSTSAASPSAPAQRASLIANSHPSPGPSPDSSRQSRHIREASSVSNPPATVRRSIVVSQDSDTSDSEDDAPLASLVPPRRPGSSMSHRSNRSQSSTTTRAGTKPLIDISTLTGPNRRPLESGASASASTSAAFTPGKTLVSSPVSMTPPTPPITSTSPPTRFVSPPGSPVKPAARTLSADPPLPPPQPLQRTIPVRKGTAEREGLNERLGKVMMSSASSVASSSSVTSSSASRTPALRTDPLTPSVNKPVPVRQIGQPTTTSRTDPPTPSVRQIGHRRTSSDNPSMRTRSTEENMDDLVRMLGGGIRLISMNGEDEDEKKDLPVKKKSFPGRKVEDDAESTEDETEEEEDSDDRTEGRGKKEKEDESISPPIPILRRTPVPSFSVTSRPQQHRGFEVDAPRQRTSSLVPSSPATSEKSSLPTAKAVTSRPQQHKGLGVDVSQPPRQRTSSLVPSSPATSEKSSLPTAKAVPPTPIVKATPPPVKATPPARSVPPKITTTAAPSAPVPNAPRSAPPSSTASNNPRQRSSSMMPLMTIPASPKVAMFPVPTKPFATPRESPASSTGDSSSGRAPLTPRDGSDIVSASGKKEQWSGGASGLGLGHKRRSVSFDFEEDATAIGGGKGKGKGKDDETRRRDRRRDEAKAAIELGNVINGRGPIVDDDEDDTPINQINSARMGTMGPMMGGPMMGFGGPAPGWNGWPAPMMNMNMNPQMLSPAQFMAPPIPPPGDPAFFAAHQQAMMYAKQAYQMAVAQQAMAAAGDEWERSSAIGGSVYGGFGGAGAGWSSGASMIFPSSSQSMYGGGGGGARSEYGGGGGGGGGRWSSSQSVYGESFGDRRRRGYAPPPVPPVPSHAQRSSVVVSGKGGRTRTVSQPANPVRPSSGGTGNSPRRAPPSSWKAGV